MSAHPLLDIIAGHDTTGYYEIRYGTQRPDRQEWIPATNPGACHNRCAELAATADVYVGATPRTTRQGGQEAITQVWCLWVDLDAQKADSQLNSYPYPPTLEIASGSPGNLHAWWALERPLPPLWAGRAIRKLVHHLGADPAVKDVARVMRPPGTLNHKSDPPTPVEIVAHRPVKYTASQLVADIPDPQPVRIDSGKPPVFDRSEDLERIPAPEYFRALTGREVTVRGLARCPIHKEGQETNPSLKLYDGGTWFCFGCGLGGDIYSLGEGLFHMNRRTQFPALRERLLQELGMA